MAAPFKDRLLIASMCENWRQVSEEWGLRVEADHFCQAENMEGIKGEAAKAELARLVAAGKVSVLHAPFNELHPAAIDPRARALAMDRLNQAADIALESGIRKMVVHSGYVPFVYFKEWHHDRSVEFWQEFMADKPSDFEICIENVLDDEPGMLADIAKAIGDKRVGLCLDVGHANVVRSINGSMDKRASEGASVMEWLEVTAPYLKHLHLHNNDGTGDFHGELTDGAIDIGRLLDAILDSCSSDTTLTLELINCEKSLDWLRSKEYY